MVKGWLYPRPYRNGYWKTSTRAIEERTGWKALWGVTCIGQKWTWTFPICLMLARVVPWRQKAPPITYKPWPKTDQPWSRIHVDFAGPMEDIYYLIVVDSYTKWLEVLRCQRAMTGVAITFLYELFARLGVVDCLVSNNGTQFTLSDFKEFCDTFQIKHITTPPYHPRSNGLEERFVDTLKRALKKASGTPSEKALQPFLQVYRITPNPNTPDATSPAETMFARKIRPVFEKLLPKQASLGWTTTVPTKRYNPGDKVFFKAYSNNTSFWEPSTKELETRHTSFWALPPHMKDTWTKSGGDGWMTLAAHPKTRKKLSKRCTIRLISNLHKQP